jgi:DNA-binding NtrC family response regulator
MIAHALIVEDNIKIARQVGKILTAMEHSHDHAGNHKEARLLIAPDKYDYALIDLEIPIDDEDDDPQVANGEFLLSQIRGTPGMESVPVIVMTGHGLDSHELVVRVWNAGAVNFVGKPVTAAKLSKVINDALDHCASADSAAPDQKPLQPFHDPQENTRRKMVIYPDRVTLCGAIVWQDKLQPDMRTILLKLSEKTKDGYKRITGPNLINPAWVQSSQLNDP